MSYLPETPSQTAGPYVHIGLIPNQAGFDIFQNNFGGDIAVSGVTGERIVIEGRIKLQLDEMADGFERVAEQETAAFEGAEQVADHRESAALDAREEQGGALGLVDAALDLRHLEMRIDLGVDADEMPMAFEVADAILQAGVSHKG